MNTVLITTIISELDRDLQSRIQSMLPLAQSCVYTPAGHSTYSSVIAKKAPQELIALAKERDRRRLVGLMALIVLCGTEVDRRDAVG